MPFAVRCSAVPRAHLRRPHDTSASVRVGPDELVAVHSARWMSAFGAPSRRSWEGLSWRALLVRLRRSCSRGGGAVTPIQRGREFRCPYEPPGAAAWWPLLTATSAAAASSPPPRGSARREGARCTHEVSAVAAYSPSSSEALAAQICVSRSLSTARLDSTNGGCRAVTVVTRRGSRGSARAHEEETSAVVTLSASRSHAASRRVLSIQIRAKSVAVRLWPAGRERGACLKLALQRPRLLRPRLLLLDCVGFLGGRKFKSLESVNVRREGEVGSSCRGPGFCYRSASLTAHSLAVSQPLGRMGSEESSREREKERREMGAGGGGVVGATAVATAVATRAARDAADTGTPVTSTASLGSCAASAAA
ncbi:unnamed protein product [Lampetra planeri]